MNKHSPIVHTTINNDHIFDNDDDDGNNKDNDESSNASVV